MICSLHRNLRLLVVLRLRIDRRRLALEPEPHADDVAVGARTQRKRTGSGALLKVAVRQYCRAPFRVTNRSSITESSLPARSVSVASRLASSSCVPSCCRAPAEWCAQTLSSWPV
jgi:hypothetical protein